MAELRSSTSIGGNLVWHSGNLRFDTQGETIRYSGHKIFTEHDTPTPSELGDGLGGSAYTKDEADATFAPLAGGGYVQLTGDTMSGKLTNTANDIEITGTSPRLTLTDTTDSKKWFAIVDSTKFSIREDNTSTTRLSLDAVDININVENFQLNSKTALRDIDGSWLRINDNGAYASGTYFGNSLVRTDGQLQVGVNGNTFNASSLLFTYKSNNIVHAGGGTWAGNHTWSGNQTFNGLTLQEVPDVDMSVASQQNTLQIRQSNTSYDAFMSFHIKGDYAVHFGLDGSDNRLKVGGWSLGAAKYAMVTEIGGTWTGTHTWSGNTTFSNNVTCSSTPTASTHLTNKAYVDSKGVDLTGDYLWTGDHIFDAVLRPRIVSGSDSAPGGTLAANSAYDGIGIGEIANDSDYPTRYGALLNVQDHVNRGFQLASGNGGLGGQQDHELWFRRIHSYMTNGYSDWVQLIHSGGGTWGGNHVWTGTTVFQDSVDVNHEVYIKTSGLNTGIRFAPGVVANDYAGIRLNGTNNAGYLEFWTSDDYSEPFVFRSYDTTNNGDGTYREWAKIDGTGMHLLGSKLTLSDSTSVNAAAQQRATIEYDSSTHSIDFIFD